MKGFYPRDGCWEINLFRSISPSIKEDSFGNSYKKEKPVWWDNICKKEAVYQTVLLFRWWPDNENDVIAKVPNHRSEFLIRVHQRRDNVSMFTINRSLSATAVAWWTTRCQMIGRIASVGMAERRDELCTISPLVIRLYEYRRATSQAKHLSLPQGQDFIETKRVDKWVKQTPYNFFIKGKWSCP